MDQVGLNIPTSRNSGFIFTGWRTYIADDRGPPRVLRFAHHVRAAAQLRQHFTHHDLRDPVVDALLTPEGRVVAARGEATSRSAQATLRAQVKQWDRVRGSLRHHDPDLALELWQGLLRGTWSLVDWFDSDGRRFVVARRHRSLEPADPRALTAREQSILTHVAEGSTVAEVAYALGTTTSAVQSATRTIFRKLAVHRRLDLIRGVRQRERGLRVSLPSMELGILRLAPFPVPTSLTVAEGHVARALLAGLRYREIAQHRGVSVRTIEHQIASIFRKLNLHSREMLACGARELPAGSGDRSPSPVIPREVDRS